VSATQAIVDSETAVQPFPFLDLRAQFATIRDDVMQAVARVMESQHFILGPEVAAFEKEVAAYIGCRHAIGCANGSDALVLALMALGVGAGDEVVSPPFTFVATAGSVARLGAKPVFADIDPVTYNIDPAKLEAQITPRTKAIIVVHLFGLAADMNPIMAIADERGIPVIEDAAQAIGAEYKGRKVGSRGAIGCFSFFPSKNLGGAGDGGLITTESESLADALRVMRVHGSRGKYDYERLGFNSRLDALQAAILRVKLGHLGAWTEGRRRNAATYRRLFAERGLAQRVQLPIEPAGCKHIYNQFTIRTTRRDALRKHLQERGIPSEVYYPHALHLQPAFRALGYGPGDFPEAERACGEVLSLPIYPELSPAQLNGVVSAIAAFYGGQ
jgi:dTDP-4-amino-4,6-dideoxygalactose transaminase